MENNPGPRPQNDREWRLLEKMLLSIQDENRKQRRWSIFFRALTFIYLFFLLVMFMRGPSGGVQAPISGEYTAVIDISGVIAPDTDSNADLIVSGLREAFEAEGAKAVLLRINSPGGSPVQSRFVYSEILRLRDEYPEKKLYAAITDVGASGAYYIASAADEIYADPASIVGSIGVIMASFGFTEAMDKLGVERRVLTAGDNKAVMDPFMPIDEEEREHVQDMLDTIHNQFIAAVKQGRGDRLNIEQYPEIFSGLFWTGAQAQEMGLVDGLMSPGQVAREVVGAEDMQDFTPRPNPLDEFMRRFGVSVGEGIANTLGLESASLR